MAHFRDYPETYEQVTETIWQFKPKKGGILGVPLLEFDSVQIWGVDIDKIVWNGEEAVVATVDNEGHIKVWPSVDNCPVGADPKTWFKHVNIEKIIVTHRHGFVVCKLEDGEDGWQEISIPIEHLPKSIQQVS